VDGFQCIAKEAALACELLRRGAEATGREITLCNCIRQCALSLMDMEGPHSHASAAAMVVCACSAKKKLYLHHSIFYANHHSGFKGVAKEARKMCDWMRKENELYDFNSYNLSHENGLCDLIRMATVDVMKHMLSSSRWYDIHHFHAGFSLHGNL
jgi:hypothetical protein